MTTGEQEHLRATLRRRQALRRPGPARPRPLATTLKGLAYGAGTSVVLFFVWREVVWQAFLGFSFLGGLLGWAVAASTSAPERPKDDLALDAMLRRGEVEECEYEVSGVVVLRNDDVDIWFLQVGPDQVLCRWDQEEAREHLTLVLARHGDVVHVLSQHWSGQPVKPQRPRRAFRVGEYRPRYAPELLSGRLEHLDALLRERGRDLALSSHRPVASAAQEVEALGFYKFVEPERLALARAEFDVDVEAWLLAAERSFAADGDELAEGGVAALLQVMQPALAHEGVVLGEVSEWYREGAGVSVKVGSDEHTLWRPREPRTLLVTRIAGFINTLLETANSEERLFVRGSQLVLLTPALSQRLGTLR